MEIQFSPFLTVINLNEQERIYHSVTRTVSSSGVKPQKRDVGWHLPHHLARFLELENRFWISHNTPNNTIIQVTINLLQLSSSKEILV